MEEFKLWDVRKQTILRLVVQVDHEDIATVEDWVLDRVLGLIVFALTELRFFLLSLSRNCPA